MHAAGVKLQNMIKRTRRHLFVFVTNRELPTTNNGSERALRPARYSAKSPTAFVQSGAPNSTPTSAPSSKPHVAAQSEP